MFANSVNAQYEKEPKVYLCVRVARTDLFLCFNALLFMNIRSSQLLVICLTVAQ